ncbi:MAG: tetratricopeptide repeat protein [Candidatus Rifleibacteriota bacterium]
MIKRFALFIALVIALFNPLSAIAKTGVVKGSYINIRKDSKFAAPIVGKKLRGDRYEILFEENFWVKVKFKDGTQGWIYKTLVERIGGDLPEEEEPKKVEKPKEKKEEKKKEKVVKKEKPAPKKDKKTKKKKVAKPAKKDIKPGKKVEKKPEKEPAEVVEISATAEELYNEAIRLYEKRRFSLALKKNNQALKKAPQNAEILNNIGNCQFKMGRIQQALDAWKNALKVSPKSGKITNNLGIAYYQLNKNKKAIEYYKKAILFEPQFPDPYYNLASVYGFSGKFEDAILNYKKFLEFSPEPVMKKLAQERVAYCERQLKKLNKKSDKKD